jgi:hypothetical protein
VYKTFHVTERQAVQFRISAFNWLNHPLEQFSSGNQVALPFFVDYNTHAISLNTGVVQSNVCPLQPDGTHHCSDYGKRWGSLDYKNGYPGGRIMELSVKYTF